MNPGARNARPGSIPVMKNDKSVYERAIALLEEMLDLMEQIDNAPPRLFPNYLSGKERRILRRRADRLRKGEARPVNENLFSATDLAKLLEDTVAANELREKTGPAFERNFNGMGALIREDGPAVKQAIDDFFSEALRKAQEAGPDSDADRRWKHLEFLIDYIKSVRIDSRREKPGQKIRQEERKAIVPLVPAQLLSAPPPDEPVIPIPAEDSGRERMFIRIGNEGKSWVGSFECGSKTVSSVFMLPDRKNIFVSADGAGYIIDWKSRALVERTGTAIVGTMRDYLLTIFVVIHDGVAFEAFGENGRLWKTAELSDRPLRNVVLEDDQIVGEAWKWLANRWMPFTIKTGTGEVSLGLGI